MDLSSLSGQLNIPINELRNRIREAGFRIPPRARKLNNTVAREIIRKLSGRRAESRETKPAGPSRIEVGEFITVKDFSQKLNLPITSVIKKLMENGVMATINEEIDAETAAIIGSEFGVAVEVKRQAPDEMKLGLGYVSEFLAKEDPAKLQERPPIVAVMGHVDHGKTTLLDTIRKTNVVATEAGAITQHIGAYQVEYNGKLITFLDTPGHEAFAAMRARGSNVTDIIVLVVAADDSVKPQTVEVINRAKLTKTPLVVALNKIDKSDANPERVKGDLANLGVTVEEWGGKVPIVSIAAKPGVGIDKLLEIILLTAEVEELRANPEGQTLGAVIDSRVSRGKGPVATVLVQNGTLNIGDAVMAGTTFGKLRSMEDALGKKLKGATPSTPVVVSGLSDVPEVGDILKVMPSLEAARQQALNLEKQERAKRFMGRLTIKTDPNKKELKIIVRAGVQGSLEVLMDQLSKLDSAEVKLTIVDQGVGEITESDIQLAENTQSVIIGFHARVSSAANKIAKQKKVTIDLYDVIYELVENLTEVLLSMMPLEITKITLGRLKIKAVFRTEKDFMIIGGEVTEGRIVDKKKFEILRVKERVGEGKIEELQQSKVEVNEVGIGHECGLRVKPSVPVKEDDILMVYDETAKKRGSM